VGALALEAGQSGMKRPVGHPIFLDLRDERVIVIGGGEVAERKVSSLVESGARVTVIAPACTPALTCRAARGEIRLLSRSYAPGDLDGCRLAYAATDDPEVNRAVHAEATARGVWLNVADQPDLCSFTVPAMVRRGDLTIAVSTNGASPALARRIREELERRFGPEYGELLQRLRSERERLSREEPDPARRRGILAALAEGIGLP
jgi:precorrin-2 dehydrogenase/sirohydrochlorin ferrochelatase